MRIVSQKRDLSVDFDRCEIWTQNNVIYRRVRHDSIPIGVYATQERAKEVFEDMHNAYAPIGMITTNLTEEQAKAFIGSKNVAVRVVQMDDPNTFVSTYDNYIYYMPEK